MILRLKVGTTGSVGRPGGVIGGKLANAQFVYIQLIHI